MKLIQAIQGEALIGTSTKWPIGVDPVGDRGAPLSVTFNLYDDPTATNLRGLWQSWSEYEQGEVVYLTPEGPESGDSSQRTPSTFGAWVALKRTQHSEPESSLFWAPMKAYDTTDLTSLVRMELNGGVVGTTVEPGVVTLSITGENEITPGSYVLSLEPGKLFVARGQVILRHERTDVGEAAFPEDDLWPDDDLYP
jgi:hypothetical protein